MNVELSLRHAVIVGFLVLLPAAAIMDLDTAAASLHRVDTAVAEAAPIIRRLPTVEIGQQDWFQQALQQLQALGGSYVRLERIADDPPSYQFHCQTPSGTRPNESTLEFSADGDTPRESVAAVLSQVRRWHDQRLTSESSHLGEKDRGQPTSIR